MRARGSLDLRYAYNDLIKNKGVNIAILVMLVLSAFLMATGSMVMERLVGSVDRLFEQAKPPHFLQMHRGDHDQQALEQFASQHPEIDAWLIEEMVGFDGAGISWDRPTTGESGDLADSLIDHLFVSQNADFDFLIDETGSAPHPTVGEVYVPVALQQSLDLRIGDELSVRTAAGSHPLTVRGFVRDAQMASSMSSATRLLTSPADVRALQQAGGGASEIIVEYRLTDPSLAADFQTAYESAEGLPKNGQAVTFQMIRIINVFSDGLVAASLMFVSLLLTAIALLNVRFVIRGTLEDEVHQIGAMKAIGLPHRAIARLYLAKYATLTLLACMIGGALALIATPLLTQSIKINFAEPSSGAARILVPLIALALLYVVVIGICHSVFNAVRRTEVVSALVHGSTLDERQTARRARRQARRAGRTRLASYRGDRITHRLTLLDLRAESGQWALVPAVFFLAVVVMTLPANLLSTFESPRFVNYMGATESDLFADLQFTDDVDAKRATMVAEMRSDAEVTDVRTFANVLYDIEGEDGPETLRVEVGDYADHTGEFIDGGRPGPGQIALSALNVDKYGLAVGDVLTVSRGGRSTTLVVSGTYQDVTSGGYTAKTHGEVTSGANSYVIYANVADGVDPQTVAADYGSRYPGVTVTPMQTYVQQTLSYVTSALKSAAIVSGLVGIGVVLLITCLFLQLRLARDRGKMGVLSAIGFSTGEIIAQVRGKMIISMAVGIVLGEIFAATAGESLVGLFISLAGLGIAQLEFIPNPWLVYVTYPLLLIGAGYLGAALLTTRLRRVDKSSWLT